MGIFNQSVSVFDFTQADQSGILPLQITQPTAPAPSSVSSGTNLIIPDAPTIDQLINFPEEIYDLRETSHLVRLMKVLLGDSGAGQLRKRILLARLESYLTGANFFDIDRFYGAIFGALRSPEEQFQINPMDDVATPDEWDQLQAADCNFRERIMMLAKAIMMGATIPGLKAAAQAIVAAPVDIYETWSLLDAYGPSYIQAYNTWAQEEILYPTWDNFSNPTQITWSDSEGVANIGRLPKATRGEIVVRPHKNYAGLPAGTKSRDESALVKVLNKLKPASTIVTVATDSDQIHIPVKLANMQADSNYWEVVRKVAPDQNLPNTDDLYPMSQGQIADGVDPTSKRLIPVPPFSQGQGVVWSINSSIRQVRAYSRTIQDIAIGDVPSNWYISPIPDEQTLVFPDGVTINYDAEKGVLSPQRAAAALVVNDGSLIAHPYSGDRQQVEPHA